MASVILPRRNEPRSSGFMTKFTNNGNLNFNRLQNITSPNPNPNPNPNSSQFFVGNTSRDVLWQQLPYSAPPKAAFNRSSINSVSANSNGHRYRYITFRLGSYTRRELKDLKKRLIFDLERVRVLRHWISTTPIPHKKYHPPQLELPRAPEVALTGKERQKSTVGQKRTKPSPAVRDTKKQCGRVKSNAQRGKVAMRKCGQILATLKKHKNGWVFNSPVDVVSLKLYDYHSIISNPMDLGTIERKLAKNEYESPLAFASDVRLTFQNAMVYNGKGSEVFDMAERMLLLFEDMFNQSYEKFIGNEGKKKKPSAKTPFPLEKSVSNPAVLLENPMPNPTAPQLSAKPTNPRDAKKPEMTEHEKAELAANLLNLQLSPEGTDQIMGIIKGVLGMERFGDEIELDLEVLDNETLWELHSFIGCCRKKTVTDFGSSVQVDNSVASELVLEEEGRKRDGGEEDIDIGEEEMQATNVHCVEIEKDAVHVSSSSSYSSSSSGSGSSSSDSGSDGSSSDESGKEGNYCNVQEANSTPKCPSMGI